MTDKSLSTEPMSIPDLVRGLSLLSGLSQQELAVRAGVSPGSVTALFSRTPKSLLIWLRMQVHIPQGSVDIALCAPGGWRPGMSDIDEDLDEKPVSAARSVGAAPNRSRMSADEMLDLYDRGASIGEIARKAGVSRQRIHKLAMDHGRPRRREQHREQRVALGRETLGLVRPRAP